MLGNVSPPPHTHTQLVRSGNAKHKNGAMSYCAGVHGKLVRMNILLYSSSCSTAALLLEKQGHSFYIQFFLVFLKLINIVLLSILCRSIWLSETSLQKMFHGHIMSPAWYDISRQLFLQVDIGGKTKTQLHLEYQTWPK